MGAKFWAITRDTETVNMAASVGAGTASLHTGGKIVKIKQPSATTISFISVREYMYLYQLFLFPVLKVQFTAPAVWTVSGNRGSTTFVWGSCDTKR